MRETSINTILSLFSVKTGIISTAIDVEKAEDAH
jgi:hypothetical protein